MKPKSSVIIDCDNTYGIPGHPIDDGQAIAYLAGRPEVEIVGISCTYGNGSVDEVFDATRWLVEALGLDGLSVLKGASGPGDYDTEAASWLARQASDQAGAVSLLAIGTMSNLLGAKRKDPRFFSNLRGIAAMGGYLYPLPIRGWNRVPELNLSRDPMATAAVLEVECPVTIMSAQICLQAPFGIDELRPIAEFDRPSYFYMLSYLSDVIRRHEGATEFLWDLLPAAYLSFPELFHDNEARLSAEPSRLALGLLEEDSGGPKVNLPDYIIDVDAFYSLLYESWKRAPLRSVTGLKGFPFWGRQ
jgi:inosine-uridine nucleoside N-ribohydrolase